MVHRDITMEDLQDKLTTPCVDLFDALCMVAERAKEIYDSEEDALLDDPKGKKPIVYVLPLPKKRSRDEASPSSPSREPKRRRGEPGPALNPVQRRAAHPPPLPEKPPLPAEFHAAIEEIARAKNANATAAKLVIQKELYLTDLSSGHNRLSIPFNKIENDFLTEEEKEYLLGEGRNKKKLFKEVRIVQPSLAVETVKLCRWDMPKEKGKMSSTYVIRGNWSAIADKNKLKVRNTVQLWSFRVGEELCLALVKVPRNRAA